MKQSLPIRDRRMLAELLGSVRDVLGGVRWAAPKLGISAATFSRYSRASACPHAIDFRTYQRMVIHLEKLDQRQRSQDDQRLLERVAHGVTSAVEDDRARAIFDREHQQPSYVRRLEAAVTGADPVPSLIEYWAWVRAEVQRLQPKVRSIYRKAHKDPRIHGLLEGFLARYQTSRRDRMRARLSIYRSLEPLVAGPTGKLAWSEMFAQARYDFLTCSLRRERILLTRPDEEIRVLLALAQDSKRRGREGASRRRKEVTP